MALRLRLLAVALLVSSTALAQEGDVYGPPRVLFRWGIDGAIGYSYPAQALDLAFDVRFGAQLNGAGLLARRPHGGVRLQQVLRGGGTDDRRGRLRGFTLALDLKLMVGHVDGIAGNAPHPPALGQAVFAFTPTLTLGFDAR